MASDTITLRDYWRRGSEDCVRRMMDLHFHGVRLSRPLLWYIRTRRVIEDNWIKLKRKVTPCRHL